ncbi:MAG: translation initiation factor IF-2, partial [Cyclobacteriaceae bacterium]|nr:translation initiation factor IF-2 [Cyclobacteriaceae bacterium]
MAEEKMMRLSQIARKLNVGRNTIVDHLADKGFDVDSSPNAKITSEQYAILAREFADSALDKEEAHELTIGGSHVENLVIGSDKSEEKQNVEEKNILIKGVSVEEEKKEEVV